MSGWNRRTWILVVLVIITVTVQAAQEPAKSPQVAAKAFRHADLDIPAQLQEVRQLPTNAAAEARARLIRLGVAEGPTRIDPRSGRFATLLPAEPMVPGRGVGNTLSWNGAEPRSREGRELAAWNAFRGYLEDHKADLRIDPAELGIAGVDQGAVDDNGDLSPSYRIASHPDDVYQIHIPRMHDGYPVRDSFISGFISHGNLTLLSIQKWGDFAPGSADSLISLDEARFTAETYLLPLRAVGEWGRGELIYVPTANAAQNGVYHYRLTWAVKLEIAEDPDGSWETLVDAQTGEILAHVDWNQYAEVKGGVYPVTNDGVTPDGVEQAGWPMPYQDTTLGTTDTGGNVAGGGSITATFFGPYVNINDVCGSDSLTQNDDVDWGTSGGDDCTTPGFGGAGNTHASRTGFYELNKLAEMGRGQLPSNTWLQARLTSNMNLNSTCNAFWNGSTVNFYRSGNGCSNTGEIAGVFDHEWGHGLDDNDVDGVIASPSGEGIADIYTALRLNDSCIGRGFRSTVCPGFGDPCLTCTGVRDIDYLKRASGSPHTYTWSNANCGGIVHCVGSVYAEAVWSLWKRHLQSAPYDHDNNTAQEIVTRLTYIAAGMTSTWFSGGPPFGGCGGSSGYLNFLAADDDNGDINDGTPHMTAIFNAFNDQEIACNTPLTLVDSGCADTPSVAPTVATSAGDQSISLSWNSVADATKYQVFRTEGVFACDFGKVKLGETAGTSWNDTGLQNGRDYSYVVIPVGTSDTCMGPASACATDAPVGEPNYSVSCLPASLSVLPGSTAMSTCTVTSRFGYTGTIDLSCSGNPALLGCSFSPSSVVVPVDGSAASTLTLTADPAQATGIYDFDVVGDDGSVSRTSAMSVAVRPEGCSDNVPLQISAAATSSGGGVGSYGPDKANDGVFGFPDSCGFHWINAGSFASGAWFELTWPTPVDICQIFIDTKPVVAECTNTNRILSDATIQWWDGAAWVTDGAVAAQTDDWDHIFTSPVTTTRLRLFDVFTDPGGGVQASNPVLYELTVVGDCSGCDDGLFCNGVETCTAGICQAGTAPSCDDGVSCTDDACNEETDSCDNTPSDTHCDNGLFCDGAESCDAVFDCQAGTAPSCDDGVSCTDDACNEEIDSCESTPSDAHCDNGLFCDGAESCDAVLDCQAGTAPSCDDGVSCTDDACNEEIDSCDSTANDAHCDNGLFCDGAESCDAVLDCQAGTAPSCDDGVSCTGDACNEETDSCDSTPNDAHCDNGLFCDGAESCDAVLDCQAGTSPCTVFACDEVGDVCVPCSVDADCDDGLFCTGSETCDAGFCIAGSDPCPDHHLCDEDGAVCIPPVFADGFESGNTSSWSVTIGGS